MEVPDSAWDRFLGWVSGFGSGGAGLAALAIFLLAVVAVLCLPRMWKDYLDYKKSIKEIEPETKKLDILLIEKLDALTEKAKGMTEIKVSVDKQPEQASSDKKKERKK
jgi:hypothetical protein